MVVDHTIFNLAIYVRGRYDWPVEQQAMKLGHMQPAHVAVRNLCNKRQRSDNGRQLAPWLPTSSRPLESERLRRRGPVNPKI